MDLVQITRGLWLSPSRVISVCDVTGEWEGASPMVEIRLAEGAEYLVDGTVVEVIDSLAVEQ